MRYLSPPDSPSSAIDEDPSGAPSADVSEAQSHYTRQHSDWKARLGGAPGTAASAAPACSAFVAGGSLHSMSTQNKAVLLPPSLSGAATASAASAPPAASPASPPAVGVLQMAAGRPGAATAVTSSSAAALVAKAFGRGGGNAKFAAAVAVAEKAAQAAAAGRSEIGLAPDAQVAGKPVQSFSHIKVMKEGTCLEIYCLPVLFEKIAPRDRLIIGRGEQADIHTEHPSCSRLHAEIRRTGGPGARCTYTLRDLGSGHGTLLNGGKIAAGKETELEDEDEVQLGFSQRLYIFFGGRDSTEDVPHPPAASQQATRRQGHGPSDASPGSRPGTEGFHGGPHQAGARPVPPPPPADDYFPPHAPGASSPAPGQQSWGRGADGPRGAAGHGFAGAGYGGVSGWDSASGWSHSASFSSPGTDGRGQGEFARFRHGTGDGLQANGGWDAEAPFQNAGWGGAAPGQQPSGYGGQAGSWGGQGVNAYYTQAAPGHAFGWPGSNSGAQTPGGERYAEGDSPSMSPRVSGYSSFSPALSAGPQADGSVPNHPFAHDSGSNSNHSYSPFAGEDGGGYDPAAAVCGASPEKPARPFTEPRMDMAARKKLWQNRPDKKESPLSTQQELLEHKERVIKEHNERLLQEKRALLLQKQQLVEKRNQRQGGEDTDAASAAPAAKRLREGFASNHGSEAAKSSRAEADGTRGSVDATGGRARGSDFPESSEALTKGRNGHGGKGGADSGSKAQVYCSHILLKFKRRKEDGVWKSAASAKGPKKGEEHIGRGGFPVTRTRADAMSTLESVRQIVEEDKTQFGEVAAELSDCPSSRKRGLLGWVSKGGENGCEAAENEEGNGFCLPEEAVEAALNLEVDAVSDVVESENGVHLLYRIK
ncbi:putative peptidyl-prolyl cis-trans isomerase [Neospora caninum Liverpool]|uniref:Peptidyl-prolyl cis-trans isomerase, putative n=1 Tax=Neospora caninum (strain Liverpool) TaxID=572307 RepID=F0VLH6_NEOCL|nr:putative peptidyl-prolyl cis-trans isomerase [Neospora caninum Liverpool]CBZ54104.1 putative peptidyl-prolyl cis-trans isomerase [Neospora caninum Liverpool]CEL68803.1 TPA: peptidyl-prolyl cis-trans isomerase, putative [Neospora caninum Liverpool]|eukprot:XP_003884135.1 putative peptidyl-prolyl cis-trans isomerase [Neospora caninum Liverpool]